MKALLIKMESLSKKWVIMMMKMKEMIGATETQ